MFDERAACCCVAFARVVHGSTFACARCVSFSVHVVCVLSLRGHGSLAHWRAEWHGPCDVLVLRFDWRLRFFLGVGRPGDVGLRGGHACCPPCDVLVLPLCVYVAFLPFTAEESRKVLILRVQSLIKRVQCLHLRALWTCLWMSCTMI